MAGGASGAPFEGEGTGVDRWPLREFPLLVDRERNIVETSVRIEHLQTIRASRGQCVCWRGDSDIPGPPSDPPQTPDWTK